MSSVIIAGDTSGTVSLTAPAVAGTTVITLPATSGTMALSGGAGSFTTVVASSTIGGATTIGVGAATPSASGAGITFPATQSASTDANTLDDYEEGTWTPSDASGAGLVFTSVSGTYTKIGRLVVVQAKFSYPVTANASTASIGGLPFTVGFDTVGSQKNNNGLAAVSISLAATGTIQINIFSTGGNATNAQCSVGTFTITMTYFV